MTILHVITGIQKSAGTSVFCCEVANGLVGAGHDVTIAVVNPDCKDHYPLDTRVKLISIASLLKSNGSYQIVHIHALWSPILHKVSKWAHMKRIPIVWSPHGMITPWAMNNKRWKKLLGWWLYQKWDLAKSDLIHATAESEVEDVRRMGLNNRVVIAPLGVRIAERVGHEEYAKEKVLLFVSRVQRKKGLINLVRAWSRLPADVKSGWKVCIVGPDQEGHTDEVKLECEQLGVVNEWEFVGPVFGGDLDKEYRRASLFVLPTHSENFGSVVIEALARGVPVITTKGAPWQVLEERKCGWWIDIGVDPLVVVLKKAITLSDDERHEMGKHGRQLVAEKYTWESVVRSIIPRYKEVLC